MIRYTKDGKVDQDVLNWMASDIELGKMVALLDAANERIAQLEAAPTTTSETVRRFDCFRSEDGVYEHAEGQHVNYADYARLDRERQHWQAQSDYWQDRAETAEAALAEARKDQQRYRWLRDRLYSIDFDYGEAHLSALVFEAPNAPLGPGLALDAAIDAANERIRALEAALANDQQLLAHYEGVRTPPTSEEVSTLIGQWLEHGTPDCVHKWTVTSACPLCLRGRIVRMAELLSRLDRERQALREVSVQQLNNIGLYRQRAETAEAALAEARKDSERYRWLRNVGDRTFIPLSRYADIGCPEVDSYIDAAIAREGQTK